MPLRPPIVELNHAARFKGQHGPLPRTGPLIDFVRDLKLRP
jgi:hypothetical protein